MKNLTLFVSACLISTIALSQGNPTNSNMEVESIEIIPQVDEQMLIETAPTERLKSYLQSFPVKHVITEDWYRANINEAPLNEFTEEELAHFHRYMKRFESYGQPER